MKYSEGYLRAEEPSFVRFVRDFRSKSTKESAKGLGLREQDHEILRRILTDWRAECRAIVRGFRSNSKKEHQRKALVRVSKTTKYLEGYLRSDVPNGVRFIRDLRYENTQKA
jgi:hypothetical protein